MKHVEAGMGRGGRCRTQGGRRLRTLEEITKIFDQTAAPVAKRSDIASMDWISSFKPPWAHDEDDSGTSVCC